MEKYYKISIPKPCDKDWNTMMPNQGGRFCSSCEKTVVDFTKLSEMEVQDFLNNTKDQKICGRFRKDQLNTFELSIPSAMLRKQYTFRKAFLLALVVIMGSTLFSCTDIEGNRQNIDNVNIIETKQTEIQKSTIDSIHKPAIPKRKTNPTGNSNLIPLGLPVFTTSTNPSKPLPKTTCSKSSLRLIKEKDHLETVEGEVMVVGDLSPIEIKSNTPLVFASLDTPPGFPGISKKNRTRKNFNQRIREFVSEEFNSKVGDSQGLTGTHRIYTQFQINKEGIVENIKVRATHLVFEKEAQRVLEKLPKFTPGTYQNKMVASLYSLPIVFETKE